MRLADLAEDPFVTYPGHWGSTMYQLTIRACRDSGFSPRIVQEVSQTATLVSLVAAGFGVAVAPASVRHLTVTGAVHRPLESPVVESESSSRGGGTASFPFCGGSSRSRRQSSAISLLTSAPAGARRC